MGDVVDTIAKLARQLSPPGYLAEVQRRLTLAGRDRLQDANRFLALRLVTLLLVVPAFLLVSLSPFPGLYRLLTFFLLASLLSLGPEAALNRAVSERQDNVRRELAHPGRVAHDQCRSRPWVLRSHGQVGQLGAGAAP